MKTPKPTDPGIHVEDHLGIVCKLALRYWPRLPDRVKVIFDLEDMISEVTAQVIKVSGKYNPEKSKPSTFVWLVAQRCCWGIVDHHICQRRYAEFSPLEDVNYCFNLAAPQTAKEDFASRDAVERVIEHGSDNVRRTLELLFSGQLGGVDEATKREIRKEARRHGASFQDFLLVSRRMIA